jgi:hypothetical protein
MIRRKEVDVKAEPLGRVECAAGERIVERTALDAQNEGYRRVSGSRRNCGGNHTGGGQDAAAHSTGNVLHDLLLTMGKTG